MNDFASSAWLKQRVQDDDTNLGLIETARNFEVYTKGGCRVKTVCTKGALPKKEVYKRCTNPVLGFGSSFFDRLFKKGDVGRRNFRAFL
jgi:hypothetical protein